MEDDVLRKNKVQRYEAFVDKRLKPDLVKAIAERLDLKKNIENLEKNGITSLRSMVNLGSEVYMHPEVMVLMQWPDSFGSSMNPDTRHIFVDIGLGFHVEFTWSEALQFISVKEVELTRCVRVSESCFKFQLNEAAILICWTK